MYVDIIDTKKMNHYGLESHVSDCTGDNISLTFFTHIDEGESNRRKTDLPSFSFLPFLVIW